MELQLTEPALDFQTHPIRKVAHVFRAINHPLRQSMLRLMHKKARMTVTDLYTTLKIEQSVASQHLAILRESAFVTTERNGKRIFYSVNYQRLKQIHLQAEKLLQA